MYYGGFNGVWEYIITKDSSYFKQVFEESVGHRRIHHISQDHLGNYWIGGEGEILMINKSVERETILIHENLPQKEIRKIQVVSPKKIYFLTKDLTSENRGLYSYDVVSHQLADLKTSMGLIATPMYIEVDDERNIWLSTLGEGVFTIPNHPFVNYGQKHGLENLMITTIAEEKNGDMLIGTRKGIFRYHHNGFKEVPIKDDWMEKVWHIGYDNQNNLFVTGQTKRELGPSHMLFGANGQLVRQSYPFAFYSLTDRNGTFWGAYPYGTIKWSKDLKVVDESIVGNYYTPKDRIVTNGLIEVDDNIWLAQETGILIVKDYSHLKKDSLAFVDTLTVADGLPNNHINAIVKGAEGIIWAGTKDGLCKIEKGKFTIYKDQLGLKSNDCQKLLYDHHGGLWISSQEGLSYFDGEKFWTYTKSSGLVSKNIRYLFENSKNELWIGTELGVIVLDNNLTPKPISPPPLYLEDLKINGELVKTSSKIELDHDATFRISFKAITYINTKNLEYQFRLNRGNWQSTKNTFQEFSLLKYNDYEFEVRAKKVDSGWSESRKVFFKINPPLWLTAKAFVAYAFTLILLIFLAIRWRSKRLKTRNLELERMVTERTDELKRQAMKLQEMDKIKSNFFSNISHELRTPLTLIIGPAERLMSDSQGKAHHYSKNILDSAQRLLRLINQLLDFSKLESGKLMLRPKEGKLNEFLKNIIFSFELLAQQQKIELEFCEENQNVLLTFDHDKLEKVVYNLLSNSFKFTETHGKISLGLKQNNDNIIIWVEDSGIGIPSDKIPHIFDRFYQADVSQTRAHEGSGIGLSLVKELIELHGGNVSVSSQVGKGSKFSIQLPIKTTTVNNREKTSVDDTTSDAEMEEMIIARESTGDNNLAESSKDVEYANTILVVEDNEILRDFICDELGSSYQIIEASDGRIGINSALTSVPDLIISDVMMPSIDGFELTKTLKEDIRTSHIPIILLTAKASFESKIEGLERGADDYIMKPFNINELQLRIRNILKTRKKLQEKFGNSLEVDPKQVTSSPIDSLFLEKLNQIIEDNMMDSDFGVENLSSEMAMSQSNLYRKIKAITNLSTTQFIRSIRLKKAAKLLNQNGAISIEEVIFNVGFNNPSYFNRCFKKEFGVTPSQYKQN